MKILQGITTGFDSATVRALAQYKKKTGKRRSEVIRQGTIHQLRTLGFLPKEKP